jgi:hypothetical protein
MATYPASPDDEVYDHSRAKEDARNEWQHYEDDPDSGTPPDTMDEPAAGTCSSCGDTLVAFRASGQCDGCVDEGTPPGPALRCPCGFQSSKPTPAERVAEIAAHVRTHSSTAPEPARVDLATAVTYAEASGILRSQMEAIQSYLRLMTGDDAAADAYWLREIRAIAIKPLPEPGPA